MLLRANCIQTSANELFREGLEPESSASRLQGRDDLTDVVANETETSVTDVFLHHSSKSHLGIFGHGVAFIQDDEFEFVAKDGTSGSEILDFIAHDVDASIVRGIELQCHVRNGGAVDLTGQGEDGGCLSGAWGAVEQEMRELVFSQEFLNCVLDGIQTRKWEA